MNLLFRCQFLRYPLYSILIINNNPILCLLGHIKLLPFRPISNLISNNTNNPGHSLKLMVTNPLVSFSENFQTDSQISGSKSNGEIVMKQLEEWVPEGSDDVDLHDLHTGLRV